MLPFVTAAVSRTMLARLIISCSLQFAQVAAAVHELAGLSLGRMLACVASDVDDGVESGHEEDVQVQEKNGLNGWFNYMY